VLAGDVRGNAFMLLYHAWIKENHSNLGSAQKTAEIQTSGVPICIVLLRSRL